MPRKKAESGDPASPLPGAEVSLLRARWKALARQVEIEWGRLSPTQQRALREALEAAERDYFNAEKKRGGRYRTN